MKYEINNNKPTEGDFIRVPKNFFRLKSDAFKLLVWLMQHQNGFECNPYFIKKGTGMDYRTIRKNLMILSNSGSITISSKSTTSSIITINYFSNSIIGVVVNLHSNKNIKQEEKEKQEEKQEKKIPVETTMLFQRKASGTKVTDVEFDYDSIIDC
jgi:hypothetical protein